MGRPKLENPLTNAEKKIDGDRKTKKTRMKLKKKRIDKEKPKNVQNWQIKKRRSKEKGTKNSKGSPAQTVHIKKYLVPDWKIETPKKR